MKEIQAVHCDETKEELHFYKRSSASTTVKLKKETESMFCLKYFACAITVTMVTSASNDLSGWIYTK